MNMHFRPLSPGARADKSLAPSLERQRIRLVVALIVFDVAAISGSFLAAGGVYLGEFPSAMALREATLITPLFILFGMNWGLYKSSLILSMRKAASICFYVMTVSALSLIFITFYAKVTEDFSRAVFTLGCSFSFLLIVAGRVAAKAWVHRAIGPSLHNTLIIHAEGPLLQMENAFHVDASEHGISPDSSNPANLDLIGRYMENMDRVIISCRSEDRDKWAPLLRAAGVEGEFVSDALRRLGALEIRSEPGFSSIVVSARPLGLEARAMKRAVDLAVSSLALLLLAPLMALVAILIKLEDGGPVLFRQKRMGRGNRFFWIYKFRSMRSELGDADGRQSASRDDNRITRIGKFVRSTSIDELPQFFNVWRGDMSLVGPRPHALGSQAGDRLFWEVDGRYWNRHALKPGLTGLAQIRGYRGATECEKDLTDRLQADLEYISNWSLLLDMKIMLKTLRVLIHDKAY